jgi:hypothetical protein
MNIPCNDKKSEEAKQFRRRTYRQEMKPDHDPTIHQHAQAGIQVERRKQHLRNPIQARHFIKEKYLQRVQAPLLVLGQNITRSFTTTKEMKITKED